MLIKVLTKTLASMTKGKAMKFSRILSLPLMLALPFSIMAEDAAIEQKPTAQEATKTTEQKAESSKKAKAKPKSRPSEREFDPTEEISEDLSVPFPVDI
jgi:hypothetical protein